MKKCAFLTLDQRGDFVIDDEHAIEPLERIGWRVDTVSWRQDSTPWSDFDAVIVRSAWDYWNDVPAFLQTLTEINRQTRLANPLDIIHWNLAKTYLRDLEGKGVGIVPTCWPDGIDRHALAGFRERLESTELVVKPVIGANGEDAYRLSPDDHAERLDRIAGRFRGRDCMVQKFMPAILTEGEYSLFFFGGRYSHAVLKTPAESEFRSQEERGAQLRAVEPGDKLLLRGRQALSAIPERLLYARIDFVRDKADDFMLMEMELIEPSMYLRMDAGAPERFARAIDEWYRLNSD